MAFINAIEVRENNRLIPMLQGERVRRHDWHLPS
jgi:hypothetical protein